ncbi:MAG: hypothetical protein B7Z26_11945, partial [Asticcacaulis sp. 32-58-5]
MTAKRIPKSVQRFSDENARQYKNAGCVSDPLGSKRTLRVILGDQLSTRLEIIRSVDRAKDVILIAEVGDEAAYVKHHVKKIAFVFAAMRHYADALTKAGYTVRYVKLDDPENTHS